MCFLLLSSVVERFSIQLRVLLVAAEMTQVPVIESFEPTEPVILSEMAAHPQGKTVRRILWLDSTWNSPRFCFVLSRNPLTFDSEKGNLGMPGLAEI